MIKWRKEWRIPDRNDAICFSQANNNILKASPKGMSYTGCEKRKFCEKK